MAYGASTQGRRDATVPRGRRRLRALGRPHAPPAAGRRRDRLDRARRTGAARLPERPRADRAHVPDRRRTPSRGAGRPGTPRGRRRASCCSDGTRWSSTAAARRSSSKRSRKRSAGIPTCSTRSSSVARVIASARRSSRSCSCATGADVHARRPPRLRGRHDRALQGAARGARVRARRAAPVGQGRLRVGAAGRARRRYRRGLTDGLPPRRRAARAPRRDPGVLSAALRARDGRDARRARPPMPRCGGRWPTWVCSGCWCRPSAAASAAARRGPPSCSSSSARTSPPARCCGRRSRRRWCPTRPRARSASPVSIARSRPPDRSSSSTRPRATSLS